MTALLEPATEALPVAGLPLTAAQSGMWFAQALDPQSPAQNTAECIEIHGPVEPRLFARALRRVAGEADALRVRLAETAEGPRQLPLALGSDDPADPARFPFEEYDLRGAADPDATARARMREDLARPFDLAAGPLFQHALFRVADERRLWFQRVHHAVMDGFGYSLLARRTAEVYTALAAGDEPGPSPFGRLTDLVAEDAAYRSSQAYETDRAHWNAAFADRPEAVNLAGRTALPSRTFHRRTAHIGAELSDRLKELAAGVRATWPEVLIAAQALYLSRATHTEEVVLGLPMMGRMGSAALRIPGMVMNVLPLRLTVAPHATFAELTRQVVLGIRAARKHQRYRYEEIRRDLGLLGEGRALVGPLVNVMPFDYGLTFAGAPSTAHNLSAGPVDDLTVNIYDRADGSGLRIDHDGNPALYKEHELGVHQRRFLALLARIAAADPHEPLARHGICTGAERALVLDEFNATARDVPPTTLIGPIEAQAARTPDAPALVFDGSTLTYGELNARANRLAWHLAELGVRPGALAAVAVPRSLDLVVALLAVAKAGGAYLPLDPDYPAERLAHMVEDARPAVVIADTAARVPAGVGVPAVVLQGLDVSGELPVNPPRALTPQHPAYVIYTSGSTGRPKGVVVPHGAIDNRLRWMQAEYPLGPGDRVLQKTPSGFDVSVWEFFWALRVGATIVMAAPGGHKDPAYLARTIREQAVTTCHFVPSMLQVFLAEPGAADCTGLRRVFCSGEALPRETVQEFGRTLPEVELHNLYGPTEAAVDVTYHPCDTRPAVAGPVPIGKPVWNTRLYVLDAALQPCPPGVPGELHLAGVQLATAYLGRPALTASRFVADPYGPAGSRMYRTGDLARWTEHGEIEYLGRTDHQVKLRGLRIELGEIETELAAREGITGACVLVREDRPGDQRLVGYVTGPHAEAFDADAVRDRLAQTLPDYMVPGALVVLDDFPLSPNGKLDRKALPAPAQAATGTGRAPRDPREETLTRLFAEVLGQDRLSVGMDDGFFDLGGTSLLAARLVRRIRDTLGADLAIGALFQAQTPAALAAQLDAGLGNDAVLRTLLPLRTAGSRTPLFVFHPAGGLSWCYSGLLARLDPDQPVYGLQARGLLAEADAHLPASMAEMAADYVRELRTVQPHGPYRLLGWSVGGVVAHTVAVLLQEAGEEVELLSLLDAYPSDQWQDQAVPAEADALTALLRMAGYERTDELTRDDVLATLHREGSALAGLSDTTLTAVVDIVVNNAHLMRAHRHRRFDGDVLFFTAAAPRPEHWLTPDSWRPYIGGTLTEHAIDCLHPHLTQAPHLDEIVDVLSRRLKELDR
ncbi:amino acid adenylation domain-containing protein [Streptomyces sp. B-S-A8]|uniref:Amino acid adenylation domain-containing protein n=1 Tax=Streptomyces solicavernae TaxID=3043614 RepID=A0ABT6RKZ1_9ACTN|nr:amino acid adenylation domain-containing protein [Streptomyces sp. B-S-A8]MDI3385098.1 amino acid adenylation domain-containing protein [Streptomyces sp. B-S-A8]